ncbi:TniQ family protein [Vibrio algicola]|uniref:TniQ domain-containing protein n=1 Tax=Vibrio algicola TaxID=2662262 RepID=A0A5Q0TD37_9VIBR|nr:TniQ family protein [Vibrio algicola]
MEFKFTHYPDETLESFLLRLSQYQGYERFAHFAEDLWHETLEQHEAMAGAFPFELSRVNLYHAQTSSQMRVRVFMHLAKKFELPQFNIMNTPLSHSKAIFSPNYKAVFRNNIDYPFSFLRKRFTPVCSQCLAQSPHIRQQWQFIPHQACHIHHIKLLHHCPECKTRLEYQSTESITQCDCGYDLTMAIPEQAGVSQVQVARWLMGEVVDDAGLMASSISISERYGFLLWYVNRYGELEGINMESFVHYCESWPKGLQQDLNATFNKADMVRVRPWNKTFFHEVFGTLLKDCRQLPNRRINHNPVLMAVLDGLTQLIANNPRNKQANIGDVLLSPLEASTLLSCTTDEIYRLYEFGELKAAVRLKLHSKLASQQSAFTLRSIIEMKLARMCSSSDGMNVYLPDW